MASLKRIIELQAPGAIIRLWREGIEIYHPISRKIYRLKFDEVAEIRVHPGVLIDTDAIPKLLSKRITISIFSETGPLAYIFSPKNGARVSIRIKQFKALNSDIGLALAKYFAICSVETKSDFLKYLAQNRRKYFPDVAEKLLQISEEIRTYSKRIRMIVGSLQNVRGKIMALEGNASRIYFKALSLVIPEKYEYRGKRTIPKAKDVINAIISYCNAIVRSEVLHACLLVGLDPYIGFLHKIKDYKPALVLDISEEFLVPISHRIAVSLATKREISERDYYEKNGEIMLTDEGKLKVRHLVNSFLGKIHKTKHITLREEIIQKTRLIAKYISGETIDLKRSELFYSWSITTL